MKDRKKIIILTSTGGNGHICATSALMEHLGEKYLIEPVFPLKTFLSPIPLISFFSFGRWDGESLYNYFIRKNFFKCINFFASLANRYFIFKHKKMTRLIRTFLQKNKPDLVISVMPFINGSTLEACKQLGIPFLLIPTDLNATNYLCNIQNPDYKKFILTIPFQDQKIRDVLVPAHISASQIIVSGFIIRPGFFKTRTKEELDLIKNDFSCPQNKPTILLLMGGQGSNSLITFTAALTQLKNPAHLLIAVGRSTEFEEEIKKIIMPPHITYTIIQYTDRMPDLMAIADILITKAGPNSIVEGMYSDLSIIVDAMPPVLKWEQFNIDFLTDHGFGKSIHKLDDIAPLVDELLANQNEYDAIKKRIKNFPKKNGLEEISKIIEALISQSPN